MLDFRGMTVPYHYILLDFNLYIDRYYANDANDSHLLGRTPL